MGFNCSSNSTPDSGIMRMGRGGLPSYSKSMVNALGPNATQEDKEKASIQAKASTQGKKDKEPLQNPYHSSKAENFRDDLVGSGVAYGPDFMDLQGYGNLPSQDDFIKFGNDQPLAYNPPVSNATLNSFTGPTGIPLGYGGAQIGSQFGGQPYLYQGTDNPASAMGFTLDDDSSSKSKSGDQKAKSSSTPKTNERSFFNRMTDINNDGNVGFLETMAMMSGISPLIGAASYAYDGLKNSGLGGFRTSDQSNNASSTYGGSIDPTSTEYQKLVEQQEAYLAKKKAENDGKDGLYRPTRPIPCLFYVSRNI